MLSGVADGSKIVIIKTIKSLFRLRVDSRMHPPTIVVPIDRLLIPRITIVPGLTIDRELILTDFPSWPTVSFVVGGVHTAGNVSAHANQLVVFEF